LFFIILFVFVLGLYSTYERKLRAFGLVNLANFTYKRGDKRRKLRGGIWFMYFLYKKKYIIFKPIEFTIRRRLRQKGEK
jgi:hypothetical protein